MNALVGYTGFVGSNLCQKGKFDRLFHSKNIADSYGLKPDLLIYAGMRAEKFLADQMPKKDLESVYQAQENIRKIAPEKLVLISTIDVFKDPDGVDEDTKVNCSGLSAYGLNRYRLECWVREHYSDALIIRLPALFGSHIKKNFIFDYIHMIPSMLKKEKLSELSNKDSRIAQFYQLQDNGFYQCMACDTKQKELLKQILQNLGFCALNFTDSRSMFQFYPLSCLWEHINFLLNKDIRLWHPATEPVTAGELYEFLEGRPFENQTKGIPAYYNFKTKYAKEFHGKDGYIMDKNIVMAMIADFVKAYKEE